MGDFDSLLGGHGDPGDAIARGIVRERSSGKPVAGAWIHLGGRLGYSDFDGHFEVSTREFGRRVLRASFHVGGAPEPVAEQEIEVDLEASRTTEVQVAIDLDRAVDPPYDRISGVFEGTFEPDLESLIFLPHGSRVRDSEGRTRRVGGAWVAYAGDVLALPDGEVRWRGTLIGPGSFGHMHAFEYLMRVDEVLYGRAGEREWTP